MANTLGVRAKKDLKEDVAQLLGRAKHFLKLPFSHLEIRDWWEHSMDFRVVEAYKVLKEEYPDLYGVSNNGSCVMVRGTNGKLYKMTYRGGSLLINRAALYEDRMKEAWLLGQEKWDELCVWLEHVATINYEFSTAYKVCDDLIDACGTAGQLNRALPELVLCLPQRSRDLLYGQKRASTMPFEWAAYDKDRVATASLALSKAGMMPKPSGRHHWGDSVTWVEFVQEK